MPQHPPFYFKVGYCTLRTYTKVGTRGLHLSKSIDTCSKSRVCLADRFLWPHIVRLIVIQKSNFRNLFDILGTYLKRLEHFFYACHNVEHFFLTVIQQKWWSRGCLFSFFALFVKELGLHSVFSLSSCSALTKNGAISRTLTNMTLEVVVHIV